MRKDSLAEWVSARMYYEVRRLQQEWAMSDGANTALREQSVRLYERYKKLCKVLDNR